MYIDAYFSLSGKTSIGVIGPGDIASSPSHNSPVQNFPATGKPSLDPIIAA